MKYVIERTSIYGLLIKPVEDAKLETFIDKGGDLLVSEWVLDIDNLDEFSEKYGKIEIRQPRYKFIKLPRLVICDNERNIENE